jgi:hypothetical protein
MLFAGAMERDRGDVALILAMLALFLVFAICLCLTGGLVAQAIGGRRPAFALGAVVFGFVAWWLQRRLWVSQEVAILAGWSASAAVGLALRRRTDPARRCPEDRGPADQSERW